MTLAQHGLMGGNVGTTTFDLSYLADSVMLFRYFESHGEVRQALSVVKKRSGAHERTIRELRMENGKVLIGQALRQFQGVFTGVPQLVTAKEAGK